MNAWTMRLGALSVVLGAWFIGGCADDAPAPTPEVSTVPEVSEGALNRADLDHLFAITRLRRCSGDDDCNPGAYCDFPGCAAETGVCRPRPPMCPRILAPVCGCDGVTYANDCQRRRARVPKDHDGRCVQTCGGLLGELCPDGEVCVYAPGTCAVADRQGVCERPPTGCGEGDPAVCGCDGGTYRNVCELYGAGGSVDHLGACVEPCEDNDECADTDYCQKKGGDCQGEGLCADRPTMCPLYLHPVCGCDHQTYGNSCAAAAVGVNVAHDGPCFCGGIAGFPCPAGLWCDPTPGMCDVADVGGQCVPRTDACPEIYQPVCGCDGVTYANDCFRVAAGAAKDHDGACVVPCHDSAQCGATEYCDKPVGCDTAGVCGPRPLGCPDVWDPVCGCDGQTYGNACDAAAVGAAVAHGGACFCGGFAGFPCPEGQWCDLDPGFCSGADIAGQCVTPSEACPDVWDPVCGCDGETYANDCARIAARVSKDHDGRCACAPFVCDLWCPFGYVIGEEGCPRCECREPPICTSDDDCRAGRYCQTETCGGVGVCAGAPDACPDHWNPVCGCDGQTYANPCEAARVGMNVAHEGACFCGGFAGFPCPEGQWCDLDAGFCDGADIAGQCVTPGELCPTLWDPVCGCDGKTYGNDCVRIQARVTKDHDGPCECAPVTCDLYCPWGWATDAAGCEICACAPPPPCHANADCREGAYCRQETCGGAGRCAMKPGGCPNASTLPVCGCDGQTWPSACDAAAAGVSVAHEGACMCGGFAGVPCPVGLWCDPEPGLCGGADIAGRCVQVSDACTLHYDPVCGCDGQTYGNDCARVQAKVAKDHDGLCACEPILCDLWCPYGYQRDPWGCEICACLPPKPCCDPTDEPGPHGASSCTEGATCCADGAWHCNADSGAPACDVPGPVCPDGPCCHAWAEPDCVFPVCCANGQWRCGSASGVSPCDAPGERCEVACPPVACTLFCEHGFAHGDDGCPICACAQPGAP